jgi:hypothetical protein
MNGLVCMNVERIAYCVGKWSELCTVFESGLNGVLCGKVE